MTWIEQAVEALRVFDAERPRSRQTAVGWSEVGGCRAAIGYRLSGTWATDKPDTWAAQRGTAVHEYVGPILEASFSRYRAEVETSYRGIPGHADLVGPDDVTDIKTTSLSNSRLWTEDLSLLHAKRVQAHGYAAGLIDAGELPPDATVRLLVIPVDGTYEDWWAYEEPFDRSLADYGADRLAEVQSALDRGEPLPKDKPWHFCERWCPFFSLCRTSPEDDQAPEITDPELAAAIRVYGEAAQQASEANATKKAIGPLIRGYNGTAGGWTVSTGEPGSPKPALDEEKIRADYARRGVKVPEIQKPGSSPRLTVTRQKPEAAKGARTIRPDQDSKGLKAA